MIPTRTEWDADFSEFLNTPSIDVPAQLTARVIDDVHRKLNPHAKVVFFKLCIVHMIVGTLTLFLCPQFGIKLGHKDLGFMRMFERLGEQGCMAACGIIFLGFSLVVASLVLNQEELQCIRKRGLREIGALVCFSAGILSYLGSGISASTLVPWTIGAFFGGYICLEIMFASLPLIRRFRFDF